MLNVQCLQCGSPFIAQRHTAKYCSGRCRVAATRARQPPRTKVKPKIEPCLDCGSVTDKPAKAKRCAACRTLWNRQRARKYNNPQRSAHYQKTTPCSTCGQLMWGKGRSAAVEPRCRECRQAETIALGGVFVNGLWRYRRHCEVCGNEFLGQSRRSRFCSTKCNGRRLAHAEYANETERQTAKTHRRRAKMLNAFVERVVPSKVYERDNWTCQLCNEPVDRTLHGWGRMAATLDHIVPLNLGGLHTYANVQLAHRACNSSKSNHYAGQLPLPI